MDLKVIAVLSVVLLVTDLIVLNILGKIFNTQVISVQGSPIKMDLIAASLSYVFIIAILYKFIISTHQKIKDAFLLGLLTYGIYELTTKALLKEWKWSTVIIDSVWGGVLFAFTTYVVYIVKKY